MNDCTRRCSVRYKKIKAENAALSAEVLELKVAAAHHIDKCRENASLLAQVEKMREAMIRAVDIASECQSAKEWLAPTLIINILNPLTAPTPPRPASQENDRG